MPRQLKTAGGALGCDQGVELVEHCFGRSRSGWLTDVIGLPRRMAVIRELGVTVGIELLAHPGRAGLPVVGVRV